MVVAGSGLIVGFYRRWKYPELCIPDEEDEMDMDEVDEGPLLKMSDVKKKDGAVAEIKSRSKQRKETAKHLVKHLQAMSQINREVEKVKEL